MIVYRKKIKTAFVGKRGNHPILIQWMSVKGKVIIVIASQWSGLPDITGVSPLLCCLVLCDHRSQITRGQSVIRFRDQETTE